MIQRTQFRNWFLTLLLLTTQNTFSQGNDLQIKRNEVVKQYVNLLGIGDYQAISLLFIKQGVAVSSSGIPDNPTHFYKTLFTKTISSPKSKLINVFEGIMNKDMVTAYFDFSWKNKDKKEVSAKFLDLFIFERNTAKIAAVFVFSNTFQDDIMKLKI